MKRPDDELFFFDFEAAMQRAKADDRAQLTEPEVIDQVVAKAAAVGLPVERDHDGARVVFLDLRGANR